MKKLAIISTHPIQYNAPLFKFIAERNKIQIKVFYTWEQSQNKIFDEKFEREIIWDLPLLDGYEYLFVKNISKNPNSSSFKGVINPNLISEIQNWNANAIFVFGWNHYSHFKSMRYFHNKIPVYFRGDSTLIDELVGIKTFLRRIWLKFVYSFVDKAFYVGTNNRNYFLKHGLKENQLIFAPHAIDNLRFDDIDGEYQKKADLWRKKIGIMDNEKLFLFVGKFESKKNPMIIVEVAKLFPKYKFLFVGNGKLEQELKEKAGDNVLFIDFQNQKIMPIVYRLADVFILPSKGPAETWGLAVNEAMACGKSVIVSDKVGCAIDLVKNGQNGFIFKSNDLDDLKSKLDMLIEQNLFSENTSKQEIQEWSFMKIAEQIENNL